MLLFAVSLELCQPTSNYFANPLNRISVEKKKPSAVPTHCSQSTSRQTFTDCKLVQQSSQSVQALKHLHLFRGLPTPKDGECKNLIPLHPKLLLASSRGILTTLTKATKRCCSLVFANILQDVLFTSICLVLTGKQDATQQGPRGHLTVSDQACSLLFCSTAPEKQLCFGAN